MGAVLRELPSIAASAWGSRLDGIANRVGRLVRLDAGSAKDLLSGTWLGHPLHPLLTDVTVGAWSSSIVLDGLLQGQAERASRALVGFGVLSAVPTIVSGWSDWADTTGVERRIGMLHALGNVAATATFASSWFVRRLGRRGVGVGLSMVGGLIAAATAYVGGDLVYGRGLGVDRTAWLSPAPARWTPVMDADALAEAEPVCVELGDLEILLVRRGERVLAVADVCSHRGGPLHEGDLEEGSITCPWHGSRFRLEDGSVVRGPATMPQPAYRARIERGKVEVQRVVDD